MNNPTYNRTAMIQENIASYEEQLERTKEFISKLDEESKPYWIEHIKQIEIRIANAKLELA